MIDAPTTRAEWSSIWQAVRRALATPGLLPLALLVAVLVATVSAIARRLPFVAEVLAGDLSIGLKLEFLLVYVPVLGGLPAGGADVAGLLVAAAAGVTVAVLFHEAMGADRSATDSRRRDAGIALGSLAVVVAACGPAVLAGVAGVVGLAGIAGAEGLLASLPLGGMEASLFALPAMVLAIHWCLAAPDAET